MFVPLILALNIVLVIMYLYTTKDKETKQVTNWVVYWINQDTRLDRRMLMKEQFNKLGIMNRRIPTVYSPLTQQPSKILSHIEAIKQGYSDGQPWFIVAEDIIHIPQNIDFTEVVQSCPKNADVLQLYVDNRIFLHILYSKYLKGYDWVPWQNVDNCYYMYIISRQGAEQLLNILTSYNNPPDDICLYSLVNTYTSCYPYVRLIY